ncbi:MAG: hypothetical protein MI757_13875, partial [Pirellulales bacterium]|nr:hypothetical protein [Pirellulales bacterium]
MPLKLTVGVTRKIGLPNYGSAGASCYLETDVDGSLEFANLSVFQSQVEQAFEACRRAVTDELANHGGKISASGCTGHRDDKSVNGTEKCQGNLDATSENGSTSRKPLPATDRQIYYARDLACQIPQLG